MPDGSGPAAALHSDASRDKYNFELSWLPGQRLSACTCPNEDHPGPSTNVGRGVPEIDILEAERNKEAGGEGQVVSQSAQFAPFTHDYLYLNDTQDEWWIYDDTITRPNTYKCVYAPPLPPHVSRILTFCALIGALQCKRFFPDPDMQIGHFLTLLTDGSRTPMCQTASKRCPR